MKIPAWYPLTKGYFFSVMQLLVILFLSAMLFSSCAITKPTYVFKDIKKDTIIRGFHDTDAELKIQKNDLLSLMVSSLNPAEDIIFNGASAASGTSTAGKSAGSASGYLVSAGGEIYIHKMGAVMAAGLSLQELKSKLENGLLPYLKDPIVTVTFANHFVTVIGEAGASQVINMPAEKMTILDALAASGHVTPNATLKNVMVVREADGAKEFKHLNLEKASIITSPWYYLQPKDILVISPDEEKIYTEARRTRNLQLLSTTLSLVSITLIILNRFVK